MYLDENGEPIEQGKVYLDENGDPVAPRSAQKAPMSPRDKVLGMVDQMDRRGAELRQHAVEHPYQTAAEIGIAAATPSIIKAIPKVPGVLARTLGISAERAGQSIQSATAAAKGVPLNVEAVGREGLRAVELQAAGGSMPRVASRLMQRITDPKAADLTFEEARDFYSNLSRMSANEFNSVNPTMQRQLGAMRNALHQALVDAAETVGKGEQYAQGISEYAKAGRAAAQWDKVKPAAMRTLRELVKAGAYGVGAGGLYRVLRGD